MREIKFRGKAKLDRLGWVFGTGYYIDGAGEYRVGFIEVVPETIGQFTGEFDYNNREIYEGDIVAIVCGVDPECGEFIKRHEVVFEHGAFKIGNYAMNEVFGYPMRVVGNKFDNQDTWSKIDF